MKRLPWKYLAGLIDGEGCIDARISKRVYVSPRLRITMASVAKPIMDMIVNTCGGCLTHMESNNPNWSDKYEWAASTYKTACPVLRNVVNHLILKKEQARLFLWMETNIKGKQVGTEVRDAIREELSLMKRDSHRLSETAQDRILGMLQSKVSAVVA